MGQKIPKHTLVKYIEFLFWEFPNIKSNDNFSDPLVGKIVIGFSDQGFGRTHTNPRLGATWLLQQTNKPVRKLRKEQ